jgi:2-polyprenyl-3-methyl-5-hydroxy-6-metoxy-1,4-benzoquinol methylase
VEGWNHNTHYHDRLLNAVPRPCARALDIGCGRGGFSRKLAHVAGAVDAIDVNANAVAHAEVENAGITNLRFIQRDFLTWETSERYDAITMIATLHHMPFDAAVERATTLLRPGGVLIVLGLDRSPTVIHQLAQAALAVPVSRFYRVTRPTSEVGAPIKEPEMTLRQIRTRARVLLPDAAIARHLLWRYSLIWRKSEGGASTTYHLHPAKQDQ